MVRWVIVVVVGGGGVCRRETTLLPGQTGPVHFIAIYFAVNFSQHNAKRGREDLPTDPDPAPCLFWFPGVLPRDLPH